MVQEDCLSCRLIGGLGGCTMGAYVLWHLRDKRHTRFHRIIMGSFAATFLFLGATRLADTWPFNRRSDVSVEQKST